MIVTWRKSERPWTTGEIAYLGKWKVGSVIYDVTLPHGEEKKYLVTCRLPGIKQDIGHFADVPTAKGTLVTIVRHWVEDAGL